MGEVSVTVTGVGWRTGNDFFQLAMDVEVKSRSGVVLFGEADNFDWLEGGSRVELKRVT